MDGIDYEALANVLIDTPGDEAQSIPHKYWAPVARAAVAAYREQMRARGVVEVRKDTLRVVTDQAWASVPDRELGSIFDALTELDAAMKEATPR